MPNAHEDRKGTDYNCSAAAIRLPALSEVALSSPRPIADDLNVIRDERFQSGAAVFNFNQGLIRPPVEWTSLARHWLQEAAAVFEPWTMGRVAGLKQLRGAVADWRRLLWGEKITSRNVLITLGANVAWNLVMKTISNEGEQIATTRPYFFNHHGSIYRNRRVPIFVDLDFGNEIESMQARYATVLEKDGVRAMLISNPHNPTGAHFPRPLINEIESRCRKQNKWLVLDESYGASAHCDSDFMSSDEGLNLSSTILLGSLTKSLSLGDIRVDYVIAHEAVIDRSLGFADDEYICVSQVMQHVAKRAIENRHLVQEAIADGLELKRDLLDQAISNSPFLKLGSGRGAVFGWIRLPSGMDDFAMAVNLAKQTGVIVTPGSHYGAPSHIRIGYGMCRDPLEIGIAIKHISDYVLAELARTPPVPTSRDDQPHAWGGA